MNACVPRTCESVRIYMSVLCVRARPVTQRESNATEKKKKKKKERRERDGSLREPYRPVVRLCINRPIDRDNYTYIDILYIQLCIIDYKIGVAAKGDRECEPSRSRSPPTRIYAQQQNSEVSRPPRQATARSREIINYRINTSVSVLRFYIYTYIFFFPSVRRE